MVTKEISAKHFFNLNDVLEHTVHLNEAHILGKNVEIEFGFEDSQIDNHIAVWIEDQWGNKRYGMHQYQIFQHQMIYRPGEKTTGLDWQVHRVIITSAKQNGASGLVSVTVRAMN